MKDHSRSKIPTQLSKCLEGNLTHYALAAGAAGVGLLATSLRAEAKVIYTRANEAIAYGTQVPVDLNNDGITDFTLSGFLGQGRFYRTFIQVTPSAPDNRVWGNVEKIGFQSASILAAADLPAKEQVGPNGRFANGGAEVLADRFISEGTNGSARGSYGAWANYGKGVKDRFLGFKFTINNETHYGWARLNVVANGSFPIFYATLTGYAYETIADKPILTTGAAAPSDASSLKVQPATLGHLAAGASGIPAWRRGGTPAH